MSFSFNSSLSGLNANSHALGVVGNNIANANTIGFRSGSITFADVFASSGGTRLNGAGSTMQIGNGVRTGAIHTNFAQGGLNESGSPLHAAVSGNGFFVVRDTNGSLGYTRAGDFTLNNQGFLVSPNGSRVQGYAAANGAIPQGASISAIRLPLGETLPPQVTSEATFRMNLDAGGANNAVFHASMQVYDTRGTAHTMDMTFTRQSDGSYQMSATVGGEPAQTSVDGGAPSADPVSFTFDANGNLTSPTSLSVVADEAVLNGASLPAITVNLRETNPDGTPGASNITNFARPSAVSATTQNGFPAGELEGASIAPDGVIYGVYTNGQTRVMGQFAVATFNSPEGLNRTGGNVFAETVASGQATIGAPGTGGRGGIAGGMLEQSNVNITNEFVELIQAQRGFQANSRVITTVNQTFQDLLQIL